MADIEVNGSALRLQPYARFFPNNHSRELFRSVSHSPPGLKYSTALAGKARVGPLSSPVVCLV
jgi:hypothetical protein